MTTPNALPAVNRLTRGAFVNVKTVTKDSSGNKCVILGVEAPGWQGATNAHTGRM